MVPRTKVPSWEQMFQGSNSLENEYSSIPWQDSLFVLLLNTCGTNTGRLAILPYHQLTITRSSADTDKPARRVWRSVKVDMLGMVFY